MGHACVHMCMRARPPPSLKPHLTPTPTPHELPASTAPRPSSKVRIAQKRRKGSIATVIVFSDFWVISSGAA